MAGVTPKSKLGYFSTYDILLSKVSAGKVDAYDFCYVKDTNTFYIIDKDLNPVEFKSRLDSYDTEADALIDLNSRTDTYEGKIVNIYKVDKYVPYIANKDAVSGDYYVLEISTISDIYDYNILDNKPIENIVADVSDNLVLSDLSDGYYNVKGTFKIAPNDATTHINTSNILYVVRHEDGFAYVRSLDAKTNDVYKVDGAGDMTADEVPTVEEVNQMVADILQDFVDNDLDGAIDDHLVEIMATENDISNLFNN